MRVAQVMTSDVITCHAWDSLERAAQLMWEADCGCLLSVRKMVLRGRWV
jgi:predicted transcriptional regulator